MDAFMGSYENRLDAKGRVSVPAAFRAQLRDGAAEGAVSLVLRPSHNLKCIEAWPVKRFHALTAALNNKALFSPSIPRSPHRFLPAQSLSNRTGKAAL
jgi:MraZ protein